MANLPILDVIFVVLTGGLLCLDRWVGQFMLSRPIVAAPVIGLVLGEPATGIVVGAVIELFWIDRLPLGTYLPPNDTLVAIFCAAASILTARLLYQPVSAALISLSLLLFLPLGVLAQQCEYRYVRWNERLVQDVLPAAREADLSAISRSHRKAMAGHFLMAAGSILALLPGGIAFLCLVYPLLPAFAHRGLSLLYALLPLLGVGVALNQFQNRGALPLFAAVFLIATAAIAWLRGSWP